MSMKLPWSNHERLTLVAVSARAYRVGDPVNRSLERQGLVARLGTGRGSRSAGKVVTEWAIKEAGRAALAHDRDARIEECLQADGGTCHSPRKASSTL